MFELHTRALKRLLVRSFRNFKGRRIYVVPLALLSILLFATCIGLWGYYRTDWIQLGELCEGVDKSKSYCGQRVEVCKDDLVDPEEALPRPIVIVAAGAVRSASTFVFNALRVLMRLRDPNLVAGWYEDLMVFQERYGQLPHENKTWHKSGVGHASRLEAYKSLGTSLLIKLHLVQDWHTFVGVEDADPVMEPLVDAVFTSHRDLRKAMRSVRNMGWGVKVNPSKFGDPEFCRRRNSNYEPPKALTKGEYKQTSSWVNLAKAHILCRNQLLKSAGSKLKMDIKTEDVAHMNDEQTFRIVKQMAHHIPDYNYTDKEIRSAVRELKKLRPAPCRSGYGSEMAVNPVTHYHRGHTTFRNSFFAKSLDRMGMRAISEDPVCRKWLVHHGYDV